MLASEALGMFVLAAENRFYGVTLASLGLWNPFAVLGRGDVLLTSQALSRQGFATGSWSWLTSRSFRVLLQNSATVTFFWQARQCAYSPLQQGLGPVLHPGVFGYFSQS